MSVDAAVVAGDVHVISGSAAMLDVLDVGEYVGGMA